MKGVKKVMTEYLGEGQVRCHAQCPKHKKHCIIEILHHIHIHIVKGKACSWT